MAKRKIEWESTGAEKAAKDAKDVARSQDNVASSMGGVTKALGFFTVAYAATKELIVDSLTAYADVDAVQGRIKRNFRQMGLDARQANAELEKQNRLFRENTKYGLKVSEQTKAYDEFLNVTKDVTAATEGLSLATDIQADKEGVDLAQATKIVTEAQNGKITALEKLGILTKDQTKDLAALKDENQRAAIAVQILKDEFSGAAEENAGLADTLAANEANYERLQIAIGQVVAEMGTASTGLIGRTLDVITFSEKGTFTINNFATGMENFADKIGEASTELGKMIDNVEASDFLSNDSLLEIGMKALDRAENRKARQAAAANQAKKGSGEEEFVGPALDPGTRVAIAKERQEAEAKAAREAAEAERRRKKAAEEAARAEQARWEAQMARFAEEKRLREEAADAAEEEARRKLDAAKQFEEEKAAWEQRMRDRKRKRERDQIEWDKKKKDEEKELEEESTKTKIANAELVASGAIQGAQMFIKGKAAKNIFQGTTHLAEAAGAVARGITTSDPTQFVGAGLHVAAATKFFATAGGGGGSAPPPSAAAGATTTPSAASVPSSTRRDADLAGSREKSSGGGRAVYLSFPSLWPPTRQQVKDTARLLEQSSRGEM